MAGDDFAARWPHEFDVSVNLKKVIFMISDSVTQPVLPDAVKRYQTSLEGVGGRERHHSFSHSPAVLVATKSAGCRVFADGQPGWYGPK